MSGKFGAGYFKDNVQDQADAYDPSQHYYRRGAGAPAAGPGGTGDGGAPGFAGYGGSQPGYGDGGMGQFGGESSSLAPVFPQRAVHARAIE
jgi:hypothetical protein